MTQKKKTPVTEKSKQPKKTNRTLKSRNYKSFHLSKPIKYVGRTLPSSWVLLKQTGRTLWSHKKILGSVLLIYGLLQVILVQGVFASNFSDIKTTANESFGSVTGTLTLFSYLLGTAGQTSSSESSVYQTVLFVMSSLAFIWALRQVLAGKAIRIRDAYYKGMYPLVPFILVLLIIGLQTIPALVGAWLYGVVVANGIAVAVVEQIFWLLIFFIFALLSIYMICSSLFALFIVTLPDVTPMRALRSARELVRYRRWSIIRKILIMALFLLICVAIIMLPIIAFAAIAAPVVFYGVSVVLIGFVYTYIYTVYRELLIDE